MSVTKEMAEKLYERLQEIVERLKSLREMEVAIIAQIDANRVLPKVMKFIADERDKYLAELTKIEKTWLK